MKIKTTIILFLLFAQHLSSADLQPPSEKKRNSTGKVIILDKPEDMNQALSAVEVPLGLISGLLQKTRVLAVKMSLTSML